MNARALVHRGAFLGWLVLGTAACGRSAAPADRLLVFAAASLTAPFAEIESAFESRHAGIDVQCNLAGTPQLALQIETGAPADVFAAADPIQMQRVVAAGHAAGAPQVFARNRLAIAVAAGNPRGVSGLADLVRADLAIALCGPDVPAGRYARQVLTAAGLVVHSRSDEPSVNALVAKIRLGELDAGIVYATDVAAAGLGAVAITEARPVIAEYPIVVCKSAPNAAAAAAFVAFVRSPEGQRILGRFGFAPP
ncbi:MAG: molybdate ABC transporter substrate-binding protein [Planctomycetes bacterium]|nr:molybdate ABC transporter substrate-binding protein [Planctomycetota bacterium]